MTFKTLLGTTALVAVAVGLAGIGSAFAAGSETGHAKAWLVGVSKVKETKYLDFGKIQPPTEAGANPGPDETTFEILSDETTTGTCDASATVTPAGGNGTTAGGTPNCGRFEVTGSGTGFTLTLSGGNCGPDDPAVTLDVSGPTYGSGTYLFTDSPIVTGGKLKVTSDATLGAVECTYVVTAIP